jgi:hypothetical protein
MRFIYGPFESSAGDAANQYEERKQDYLKASYAREFHYSHFQFFLPLRVDL